MHREFWEAGFRVFPLYGFQGTSDDARCDCDRTSCDVPGKHPRAANWQHTPAWDEDQVEAMEEAGHFDSGFGVLCRGLLVIDVDARNGGIESFTALSEAVPGIAAAGLIVETGSGGGSRHLYFEGAPEGVALVQHLTEYPGLDFKSSGYVVGPGSRHASGSRYAIGHGSPDDLDPAPAELIDMLRRPDRHRAEFDGRVVDVAHSDIADMLSAIDADCPYDLWIRIGMAVHHATGGTGFAVWDGWSQTADSYDGKHMDSHWHSFGRCANPVTLGTLVHHAEEGGWQMPVSFTPDERGLEHQDQEEERPTDGKPFDTIGVDLTAPPGFVGKVAQWVESQSRRHRKRLSVAAALTAIGNVAGLRYTDDRDGVTCNLFTFCVAGSGTGKESALASITKIHKAAGIAGATHGGIKSEQEITRNLTRHQSALYAIDEIGFLLAKIKNAQAKGGATYLEGVIGMLMAAYSKADGHMLLNGDVKAELVAGMIKEAGRLNKRIDDGDTEKGLAERVEHIKTSLSQIDDGLDRPFLSLIGFTTPTTFDDTIDFQSATSGFIGRALIFNERETVPQRKHKFRAPKMPDAMAAFLAQLYGGGEYSADGGSYRVEHYGERVKIPTDAVAHDMLDAAADWFDDQAVLHKGRTGLEALYLRAYEMVSKVSLILACPEGRRTREHVRWAFALVVRDLDEKTRLVTANDREKDSPKTSLALRVSNIIDGDDGETLGVIFNRLRRFKRQDVQAALDGMVAKGLAFKVEASPEKGGHKTARYTLKGQ